MDEHRRIAGDPSVFVVVPSVNREVIEQPQLDRKGPFQTGELNGRDFSTCSGTVFNQIHPFRNTWLSHSRIIVGNSGVGYSSNLTSRTLAPNRVLSGVGESVL
jgi:hypothetical protein